jgi:hypothetical protein
MSEAAAVPVNSRNALIPQKYPVHFVDNLMRIRNNQLNKGDTQICRAEIWNILLSREYS